MTTKLLALDTCTEACSAALMIGDEIISESFVAPREHAKLLLPTIEKLLAEAELLLQGLDAIAFGRGPGSFTGVRISTATAQGLAFGANLPLLPMSTLQALAYQGFRLSGREFQLAAIDARMNEIYCGSYQWLNGQLQPWVEERVCSPAQWQQLLPPNDQAWYGVGTGWRAYQQEIVAPDECVHPDELFPLAEDMVFLAAQEWRAGKAVAVTEAQPVYLRDTVTWKKLPGRE